MRKIGIVVVSLLVVLVFLIAALVFVPPLLPKNAWLAKTIEPYVQDAVGRNVKLNGRARFASIIPAVRFEVDDVQIDNASGDALARIGTVKVEVPWDPVIENFRFAIRSADLSNLTLDLTKTETAQADAKRSLPAREQPQEQTGNQSAIAFLKSASVSNGRIVLPGSEKSPRTLDGINLKFTREGPGAPLLGNGEAKWLDRTYKIRGDIAKPEDFLRSAKAPVSFTITDPANEVAFKGNLDAGSQPSLDGDVQAKGPSLSALLAHAGATPKNDETFGRFSITGRLQATSKQIRLSGDNMSVDGTRGKAVIEADPSATPMKLTLDLDLKTLDLTPYAGEQPSRSRSTLEARRSVAAPPQATLEVVALNTSLKEYLSQIDGSAALEAAGKTRSAAPTRSQRPIVWSADAIDLSALKAFQGTIRVKASQVLFGRFKASELDVENSVASANLVTTLKRLRFHGGDIKGDLKLQAGVAQPEVTTNIDFSKVDIRSLLNALGGARFVKSGSGSGKVVLTSAGASQRSLVTNLDGKLQLDVEDGTVAVDVAKLGWAAQLAINLGIITGVSNGEMTFQSARGTFDFKKGIARTSNIDVNASAARAAANGVVEVPQQFLDLNARIRPRSNWISSAIPVRIFGLWSKIKLKMDTFSTMGNSNFANEFYSSLDRSGSINEETRILLGRIAMVPSSRSGISEQTRTVLQTIATGARPAQPQ